MSTIIIETDKCKRGDSVKKLISIIFLLLWTSTILAEVDQSLMLKVNSRVEELRNELEDRLLEAELESDVVVSYEINGNRVKFDAKTISVLGEKNYQIKEERYTNSFSDIAKLEMFLPEADTKNPIMDWKMLGGIAGILSILALGGLKRKKKHKEKAVENSEEKSKAA